MLSCFCYVRLFATLLTWTPPGSSVHGTFQARILEWLAIFFSRGSSRPRDWTHISYVSCIDRQCSSSPPGKSLSWIDFTRYWLLSCRKNHLFTSEIWSECKCSQTFGAHETFLWKDNLETAAHPVDWFVPNVQVESAKVECENPCYHF